jgi:hypothetical protein
MGPQLFLKGNIPQNYFIGKYPHTIFQLKQKKLDFISGLSGVIDPMKPILTTLEAISSAKAICKMALVRESRP